MSIASIYLCENREVVLLSRGKVYSMMEEERHKNRVHMLASLPFFTNKV
jgi:hypothetical protein